jgi:hypothetical protein
MGTLTQNSEIAQRDSAEVASANGEIFKKILADIASAHCGYPDSGQHSKP